MKMSVQQWWNDTERGKEQYWEEKSSTGRKRAVLGGKSHCHFVHHKSHMD
jgi:hypothetical protein